MAERLEDVLGAWYEARDSGNPRDPADVIAEHPDLADELRVHFELMETIGATRPSASRPPTRLGCYEILSELGSGGMGTVYHGRVQQAVAGLEAGAGVALKVIHPNLLSQPGFFKRFLREAQIGQDVRHENVVRTYDCDATESDGKAAHYLVMEYVEGQTLRDLLRELERVPEELCRHIGLEVAKGLAAIHEAGVVHRDIKPENVLITEEHIVKVMDLGVARLQEEALRLSQAGSFVGSLEYAAPEQFRSAGEEADGRADLHALGVVLYELSTGQHPYRDEDAAKVLRNILDEEPRKAGEVNPQLSPFFEELVHRLIAKDRAERFPSAEDLAAVLDEGEKHSWWKDRAKALRLETRQPLRRIRIPRETALYGRDDDLARLRSLYEQATRGGGQVVLIEGEAGIGKTRLIDEFVGQLREQGEEVNFLFGSYPPGGAATAAGAFSEAYREQFGAETLEETLVEYLTPTPILIPAFAAILKGETTPKDAEPLTKDSLQTVFVHATRGLAAERTTIVLIDDLHFAPEDGRALFASLALAVPGHRILLLGTMRPGVSEDWIANVERLDHASRNVLSRLGPKDLTNLLKDAFRSERLAEELAFRIAQKSDGNPFFAFEIIRGLREGQFISQQPDGTWVTTRIIEDIQVPSSVLDLVNARVADLADDERNMLDVASCLGFEFDPHLVGNVLGLAPIPALQALARIEKRHRLVRAAGERFVFDHHQVQEALYGSLPAALSREYHGALGGAIEDRHCRPGADPDSLPLTARVELCRHYLRGTDAGLALPHLLPAIRFLGMAHSLEEAVRLADRALAIPDLLAGSERARVLISLSQSLGRAGRPIDMEQRAAEAVRVAEDADDEAWALRGRNALAMAQKRLGRVGEAESTLRAVVDGARRAADRRTEMLAQINLGWMIAGQTRAEEAKRFAKKGHALSVELGMRENEAVALGNLGLIFDAQRDLRGAREYQERALAVYEELGDLHGEALTRSNLGMWSWYEGRLAEALRQCGRARDIHRAQGARYGELRAISNLGGVFWSLGRMDIAMDHTQRAVELSRDVADRRSEAIALLNLGVQLHELDERERSQEALAIGQRVCEDIGFGELLAGALLTLGTLHAEQGLTQEARDDLQRGLRLARSLGDRGAETIALCELALISGGKAIREAVDAFASHASRLYVDENRKAQLLLWKATGGWGYLEGAKRILDGSVEHAPPEYRKSMLTNVRVNREIMEAWAEQGAT